MTQPLSSAAAAGPNIIEDLAQQTALRFIRSVTVIDDEAYMKQPSIESAASESTNSLDVGLLTKKFVEKGISCSVLIPFKGFDGAQLLEQYVKMLKTSDAAILDWELSPWIAGDKPKLCKEIIKKIINDEKGCRPRLIIIYTIETIDTSLLNTLIGYLKTENGLQQELSSQIVKLEDDFGFFLNRFKVVFLQKADKEVDIPPDSMCLPENLPDKLITHFSELATGLLSTAAFNAVSAIREKIDSLLTIFHKDLDPAFVHHLLLNDDTTSGVQFLADLFKDEIQTIVADDEIFSKCTDKNLLCRWFENLDPPPFFKDILPSDMFHKLLEVGLDKHIEKEKPSASFADGLICSTDDSLRNFSRIVALKQEAFCPERTCQNAPTLTYGSLIKLDEHEEYYLSIIPKCDSVRLTESTHIPFLKLTCSDDSLKHHICFLSDANCRCKMASFQFSNAWDKITHLKFTPDKEFKRIIAKRDKTNSTLFYFNTTNKKPKNSDRYIWIADVKDNTMQDVLQRIFQNMTRTGFDDFEWLRRSKAPMR